MPLKYYCPKCSKRFVDWGAEKLEFKCPDCAGETLYRVGTQPEKNDEAPSLSKSAPKRKAKAKTKAAAKAAPDDIEFDSNAIDDDDDGIIKDSLAIDDDDD